MEKMEFVGLDTIAQRYKVYNHFSPTCSLISKLFIDQDKCAQNIVTNFRLQLEKQQPIAH